MQQGLLAMSRSKEAVDILLVNPPTPDGGLVDPQPAPGGAPDPREHGLAPGFAGPDGCLAAPDLHGEDYRCKR